MPDAPQPEQHVTLNEIPDTSLRHHLSILKSLLEGVNDTELEINIIKDYLRSRPILSEMLTGKEITIGKTAVSFGEKGRFGEISFRDIAGESIQTTNIYISSSNNRISNALQAVMIITLFAIAVFILDLIINPILPGDIQSYSSLITAVLFFVLFFGIIANLSLKPEAQSVTMPAKPYKKEVVSFAGMKQTIIRRDSDIHYYEIVFRGQRVFLYEANDEERACGFFGIPSLALTAQGISMPLLTVASTCVGIALGGAIPSIPQWTSSVEISRPTIPVELLPPSPLSTTISMSTPRPPPDRYNTIEEALARLRNRGEIIVGVRSDFAPYSSSFPSNSAGVQGFVTELISDFGQRWGVNVRLVEIDTASSRQSTLEEQVDVMLPLTITQSNCDFDTLCTSIPYIQDEIMVIVSSSRVAGIRNFDTAILCEYFSPPNRVGAIEGTAAMQELVQIFQDCPISSQQVLSYTNKNSILAAISDGEIAGYFSLGRTLELYRQVLAPTELSVVSLREDSKARFPVELGAIVRSDRPGLRDLLDIALLASYDDGTYAALFRNYFPGEQAGEFIITSSDCEMLNLHWDAVRGANSNRDTPRCIMQP